MPFILLSTLCACKNKNIVNSLSPLLGGVSIKKYERGVCCTYACTVYPRIAVTRYVPDTVAFNVYVNMNMT